MSIDHAVPKIVAVCLPVGKLFDEAFAAAIDPACAAVGVRCERVHAEFSHASVLAEAHSRLAKSDLVLADITGRNPNLLYLAGFAHGRGKPLVLLSHHGENLPFDPGTARALIYAGNHAFLKRELEALLRGEWSEKPALVESASQAPEILFEPGSPWGKFTELFGDILREHGYPARGSLYLENESTFVLENQDMELALVQDLARRAKGHGIRLKLL